MNANVFAMMKMKWLKSKLIEIDIVKIWCLITNRSFTDCKPITWNNIQLVINTCEWSWHFFFLLRCSFSSFVQFTLACKAIWTQCECVHIYSLIHHGPDLACCTSLTVVWFKLYDERSCVDHWPEYMLISIEIDCMFKRKHHWNVINRLQWMRLHYKRMNRTDIISLYLR